MLTLRTPDERFTELPDFDHQPGFAEMSDGAGGRLRIGYVAAGLPTGDVDMPEVWWQFRRAVEAAVVELARHRG